MTTELSRPRRKTAKVDYTEKKPEDYERREREAQREAQRSKEKEAKEKEKLKKKQSSTSVTPELLDAHFYNIQPPYTDKKHPFPCLYDFEDATVQDGLKLILKSGEVFAKGDNVFMVCEPPGDPYYVARIMSFVKKGGDKDDTKGKQRANLYTIKVNWWYRARDISKHTSDSRILYASMHSDTCPMQSLRGRCTVLHRDEIEDFDQYKSIPNQFWFDKLFDRYMIKFYDVIPTMMLSNLPTNYSKALNKRFQYIFVEQGRAKEMLQSPKSCIKCNQWCSPTDSIQCCECDDTYHLLCLDPPIYKKPARGFAWSCINCVKKLERKKLISNSPFEDTEPQQDHTIETEAQTDQDVHEDPPKSPIYEELAQVFLEKDASNSFQQRRDKEEWVYRYLGMHAKLEDALDVEDRPYPRAASRLGPRHQLTGIQPWYEHQVVYYDTSDLNEEFQSQNNGKKKPKDSRKKKMNNTHKDVEEDQPVLHVPEKFREVSPTEFPPWLQPRPEGYIERGGDDTVTLMWDQPKEKEISEKVEDYIKQCAPIAESLSLLPNTPNFVDAILKNLLDCGYNFSRAMELNQKLTRDSLREPTFTPKEVQLFESGIRKYGSELWPTFKEVKSQTFAMVVRFYYLWKKTKNGHLIWDNFEGRKKYNAKKKEDTQEMDLANDADDSSYDVKKAQKTHFRCRHCKTEESTQWFRSYGVQHPDDDPTIFLGFCKRCARLWRRYAVVWEDPNEITRRLGQKNGAANRKKLESELLKDCETILEVIRDMPASKKRKLMNQESATKVKKLSPSPPEESPVSKKKKSISTNFDDDLKKDSQKEIVPVVNYTESQSGNLHQILVEHLHWYTSPLHNSKLKYKELYKHSGAIASVPRPTPASASVITMCSLCRQQADYTTALRCQGCGLCVHPGCYGLSSDATDYGLYKWACDPCSNALNKIISTDNNCVLCHNTYDALSPVKRTEGGKWAHILCCLFSEHAKVVDTTTMQPIVGCEMHFISHTTPETRCIECSKSFQMKDMLSGFECTSGFVINAESKPDSKCVKVGAVIGKLALGVICNSHETLSYTFIPFNTEVKRHKQAGFVNALRFYLDEQKKDPSGLSGAQRKFHHWNNARIQALSLNTVLSSEIKAPQQVCVSCGTKRTLKWETIDGKVLCYSCHLKKHDDVKVADDANVIENVASLLNVADEKLDGSLYGISTVNEKLERPPLQEEVQVKTEETVPLVPQLPSLPQLHTFTPERVAPVILPVASSTIPPTDATVADPLSAPIAPTTEPSVGHPREVSLPLPTTSTMTDHGLPKLKTFTVNHDINNAAMLNGRPLKLIPIQKVGSNEKRKTKENVTDDRMSIGNILG